jgi:FAD/FMN-containing dehydrogenase
MDLHQRDMTATFSSDLTLAAVEEKLAAIGQWLPIDGDPQLTLGQLVETDSTGPLRLGYGAWRDLLLGTQFHNGRNELISAGGRTVKNVAGYDLTKFMVGQFGVFGRTVTLTTRTYRRPAGSILATFLPEPERINEMLPTPLKPSWCVLTPKELLCGYLGDERTLDFYRERLTAASPVALATRDLDRDIAHRLSLWSVPSPRMFRAAVPPSKLLEFARRAELQQYSADAAFGIVVGETPADDGQLVAAAEALEGTVKFVDRSTDPPRLRFSRLSAQEKSVLERLKQAFDPDRRLNPLPWEQS